MTKLGIFDLIGLRRLHEYHGVLGLPKSPLRFYLVAERLLWHYGAKRYHPVVVAVITDLLSANYNIMSKIVLSETCQVNPRDAEPEELLDFLPLDSDMPDIANKQPSKIYSAGEYLLFLFENVWPIGARKTIRFRYVIVVCGRQRQLPICFVTLENSASISNVLCVFEANGSHSNYGALQGRDVLNDFIDKGTNLMRCRFDLGEIEELWSSRQPLKPWWKALQGRRRIARRQAA
jgi:hypothetical protein